jgi:hypothetical protein
MVCITGLFNVHNATSNVLNNFYDVLFDFNNATSNVCTICNFQDYNMNSLTPLPPSQLIGQADVCKYNLSSGHNDLLHPKFDNLFCKDEHLISSLDFNVTDILCELKFTPEHNSVCNNCSICGLNTAFNVHFIHHSVGFLNLSPLTISSNLPGPCIFPNFQQYLSIQSLYYGFPNFISKIAPIASHINVDLFRELSQGFHDQQIFDLIQYGFPLDLESHSFIPNLAVTNHGSATQFPVVVQAYLDTKIKLDSIFGPFSDPPLVGLHCSPLMTAPKDGTGHRIIVDLSFPSPQNQAVNISVSKSTYVGTHFQLKLSTTDNICQVLNNVGKNVKIFKIDLARVFRQLYLDPF